MVNIAHALGATVVAVPRTPAKLELAKELGAETIVNANEGNAAERIVELTGGGADVSIDALGDEQTAPTSLVGPTGTVRLWPILRLL